MGLCSPRTMRRSRSSGPRSRSRRPRRSRSPRWNRRRRRHSCPRCRRRSGTGRQAARALGAVRGPGGQVVEELAGGLGIRGRRPPAPAPTEGSGGGREEEHEEDAERRAERRRSTAASRSSASAIAEPTAATPPRPIARPIERPEAMPTRPGMYSWLMTRLTPNVPITAMPAKKRAMTPTGPPTST